MERKFKVLISAHYLQRDIDLFRQDLLKHNIDFDMPDIKERLSEEQLLEIIGDYDGVICGDDYFTAKVLDRAKRLKVIVKWGTGLDSIDLEYARKLNIPVLNTPNAFTDPVADSVMALVLAFARDVIRRDKLMKDGVWLKTQGHSLVNKTIGVIGFGNIGRAVAKRAMAFGMNVVANDIRKISEDAIEEYGAKLVSKDDLLKKSDYVSLNCNLNETSYHLITKKEFKLMRPEAVIINTARGPLIKDDDLIWALENKIIAGAGLDVFENEPVPIDSPLLRMHNVILSPHSANTSPEHWMMVHKNSLKKLIEGLNK